MTVKINETTKQMRLNADNRNRLKNAIVRDVFRKRSDELRKDIAAWLDEIIKYSWGDSPQARAANKKAARALEQSANKLSDRGIRVRCTAGKIDDCFTTNMAGRSVRISFFEGDATLTVCNFEREVSRHDTLLGRSRRRVHLGTGDLTFTADHPINKRFDELTARSDELHEAAGELRVMIDSVLDNSRTLGAALDKWPALSDYVASITSNSREIIVRPEDLDAKLAELRDGKKPVKQAIKARSVS